MKVYAVMLGSSAPSEVWTLHATQALAEAAAARENASHLATYGRDWAFQRYYVEAWDVEEEDT
jgi:hypothetical protein